MHQAKGKKKNLQAHRQIVHLDFLVYHVKTKVIECICYQSKNRIKPEQNPTKSFSPVLWQPCQEWKADLAFAKCLVRCLSGTSNRQTVTSSDAENGLLKLRMHTSLLPFCDVFYFMLILFFFLYLGLLQSVTCFTDFFIFKLRLSKSSFQEIKYIHFNNCRTTVYQFFNKVDR